MSLLLLMIILLPFAGSALAACMPANARNREALLAAAVALSALLLAVSLYPEVGGGAVIQYRVAWLPDYGVDFVLRMDGLAWVFVLLVLSIGLLVTLYARYYMSPQDPVPRFFSFFLAFMGAMLGVVLSGNLIQLVVFWS